LYRHDFSYDDGKWNLGTQVDRFGLIDTKLVDGKYRQTFSFPEPGFHTRYRCLRDRSFDDFLLEVDASPVSGPRNIAYGVVFRRIGYENYYLRLNTSNKFALFSNSAFRQSRKLVDWTASHAVLPQGTNRIVISAIGPRIDVFVNNRRLASVTDNGWSRGEICLEVCSEERQEVTVDFDNLAIYTPAP
jgi:hypothetical protein